MAAGGKNAKQARAQRERARAYKARTQENERIVRRRLHDNVIGGVAGGVLLVLILLGQTAYFTAGPGRPAPRPSPTATAPTSSSPATPAAPSPAPSR